MTAFSSSSLPLPIPKSPPPTARIRSVPTAAGQVRVSDKRFVLAHPTVAIVPWPDPVLDQVGHDPRSIYAERYWLPILGPTTTLLLRFLAARFDEAPAGFELNLQETSRCIGVGTAQNAGGPFYRTVERMIAFGMAEQVDDRQIAVRTRMAPLTRRQVQRLPRRLAAEHDERLLDQGDQPHPEQSQARARALALSLFELGEDHSAVESQLHRWKFHPAIAHDAVRWASGEHAARVEVIAGTSPIAGAGVGAGIGSDAA